MTVHDSLRSAGGLAVLIDPDRITPQGASELAERAAADGACAILLGNSFGDDRNVSAVAREISRAGTGLPLVQFPSTAAQLVEDVDAVLLLSLISGRNAQYLIEEHVRAVPFFSRHPRVEAISTAYCLIDGGHVTTVESVSQTRPLPADKPEVVRAHVRAAALIGMTATYLDAGSGARNAISPALIRAARQGNDGLLIVGGGIRDGAGVRAAREAGADVVVVGTQLERVGGDAVRELAHAART
jgi:geranylgeranylglyceryl phosphate synthase family protein